MWSPANVLATLLTNMMPKETNGFTSLCGLWCKKAEAKLFAVFFADLAATLCLMSLLLVPLVLWKVDNHRKWVWPIGIKHFSEEFLQNFMQNFFIFHLWDGTIVEFRLQFCILYYKTQYLYCLSLLHFQSGLRLKCHRHFPACICQANFTPSNKNLLNSLLTLFYQSWKLFPAPSAWSPSFSPHLWDNYKHPASHLSPTIKQHGLRLLHKQGAGEGRWGVGGGECEQNEVESTVRKREEGWQHN